MKNIINTTTNMLIFLALIVLGWYILFDVIKDLLGSTELFTENQIAWMVRGLQIYCVVAVVVFLRNGYKKFKDEQKNQEGEKF